MCDVILSKSGYITTTYRLKLYCNHPDWIQGTKEYYNKVLTFYYSFLLKHNDLLSLSNHNLMRQLEIMTVGNRQKDAELETVFPYPKVPLYLRRAAINDGIRLVRSYFTRLKAWEDGTEKRKPNIAKEFNASPIFYKGMYKEFSEDKISLKLWNGEKWVWEVCMLDNCGRSIPENAQLKSPIIRTTKKGQMLHVPVVQAVEDVRTVKERTDANEMICSISVPNQDYLAVLAIWNQNREQTECHFIRGGKELAHKKQIILNQIKRNESIMGYVNTNEKRNEKLWDKIRNITEFYAHQVSRQIVNYCKEQNVKIIVVPNYDASLSLNSIGYIKANEYDWIGRRILQYVKYKAFQEGIVVTSVSARNISNRCHICQEPIKKYNKEYAPSYNFYGGKNYICIKGHRGNSALNSSINIGLKFFSVQVNDRKS